MNESMKNLINDCEYPLVYEIKLRSNMELQIRDMIVDMFANLQSLYFFFFFNDPAPPEIYPLPLPVALPISGRGRPARPAPRAGRSPAATPPVPLRRPPAPPGGPAQWRRSGRPPRRPPAPPPRGQRSEEHTSELQSQSNLVCRLLLEKKKKKH